jgi:hypothetical protein
MAVELEQRLVGIGVDILVVERPAAAAVDQVAVLVAFAEPEPMDRALIRTSFPLVAVEVTVGIQGRIEFVSAFAAALGKFGIPGEFQFYLTQCHFNASSSLSSMAGECAGNVVRMLTQINA